MLIDSLKELIVLIVIISIVPLFISTFLGLVVAILQAATQLQEQSLSYLVRFISLVVVFFTLHQVAERMIKDFTLESYRKILFVTERL